MIGRFLARASRRKLLYLAIIIGVAVAVAAYVLYVYVFLPPVYTG